MGKQQNFEKAPDILQMEKHNLININNCCYEAIEFRIYQSILVLGKTSFDQQKVQGGPKVSLKTEYVVVATEIR